MLDFIGATGENVSPALAVPQQIPVKKQTADFSNFDKNRKGPQNRDRPIARGRNRSKTPEPDFNNGFDTNRTDKPILDFKNSDFDLDSH